MPSLTQAMRAYAVASSHRSLREQEADVFRRVNTALRRGHESGPRGAVRALADNGRLWAAMIDLLRDPENRLPAPLRAQMISVGLAVQRELRRDAPDIRFLLAVNENISAGLSDEP